MAPLSDPKILDENSVFARVLSAEKRPRKPTQGERLAAIFADAPAQKSPIKVADFLPRY